MNYEFTHDSIASLIFSKVSTEARTRRKVEKFIHIRYEAYNERGAKLSKDDLDYITPYLNQVTISEDEKLFLEKARTGLIRAKKRRQTITVSIIAALSVLSIASLLLWQRADTKSQENASMRLALASRYALYKGQPSIAFRLAEKTILMGTDSSANDIAKEVLAELREFPLEREFVHQDTVTHAQFSITGENILTTGMDGMAKWWKADGTFLKEFSHTSSISMAALSSDSLLVTVTKKHEIWAWTIEGELLTKFKHNATVNSVEISKDGNLILSASQDSTARVWNISENKQIQQFTHQGAVSNAMFYYGGSEIEVLTASLDSTARRWNLKGQILVDYPNYKEQPFQGIKASSDQQKILLQTQDGDYILTPEAGVSEDPIVYLFWDLQPIHSQFSLKTEPERVISFSSDSMRTIVWNFSDPERATDLSWTPRGKVQFSKLSPSSYRVLISNGAYETQILQIPRKDIENQATKTLFRFNSSMSAGEFSPDNNSFLSINRGPSAQLWNLNIGDDEIQKKRQMSSSEVLAYFNKRIRALTSTEQMRYQ